VAPHAPRAVVLLSGGLDSGVALAEWRAAGGTVAVALTADYGQRAAAQEAAAGGRLAARWQVPWQALPLPWLGEAARQAGCALTTDRPLPAGSREVPGDASSAAAVWVPARNLVLCAAAAAFAEALRAGHVVVGFNREEAATFPDNSAGFVAALTATLRHACRVPVALASPTLALDKRGIVARARALGLGQADFWSCYGGGDAPCGRCESCARSMRAWVG
jgi:7-cyano-7-deazaguanine synthase